MLLAYISLGSNLSDRAENLRHAVEQMRDNGIKVSRLSQVYETEPVETFPQPLFLNMIAEVSLDESTTPEHLMTQLLEIEQTLGRKRDATKGPRTIDLDLVIFGKEIRDTEFLQLPHPRFHQRRFVLVPLVELSPSLEHPVLRQTVSELLRQTPDKSNVVVWADIQTKPEP